MSWQPYALAALAIVVLGALVWLASETGWDEKVVVGGALGGGLGLGLMLFSAWGMLRALKEESKKEALGHVFGGFLLRLVILVVGVFALVKTRIANPISFALAFVSAVLLFLGFEVYWVSKSLRKDAALPRPPVDGE